LKPALPSRNAPSTCLHSVRSRTKATPSSRFHSKIAQGDQHRDAAAVFAKAVGGESIICSQFIGRFSPIESLNRPAGNIRRGVTICSYLLGFLATRVSPAFMAQPVRRPTEPELPPNLNLMARGQISGTNCRK
jgi:hypothetical protein